MIASTSEQLSSITLDSELDSDHVPSAFGGSSVLSTRPSISITRQRTKWPRPECTKRFWLMQRLFDKAEKHNHVLGKQLTKAKDELNELRRLCKKSTTESRVVPETLNYPFNGPPNFPESQFPKDMPSLLAQGSDSTKQQQGPAESCSPIISPSSQYQPENGHCEQSTPMGLTEMSEKEYQNCNAEWPSNKNANCERVKTISSGIQAPPDETKINSKPESVWKAYIIRLSVVLAYIAAFGISRIIYNFLLDKNGKVFFDTLAEYLNKVLPTLFVCFATQFMGRKSTDNAQNMIPWISYLVLQTFGVLSVLGIQMESKGTIIKRFIFRHPTLCCTSSFVLRFDHLFHDNKESTIRETFKEIISQLHC